MNEGEVLQNICFLPVYYRNLHLSPISIVQRSGYLEMPQILTHDRVSIYLRAHPSLVDDWEIWVENARSAFCKKVDDGYAVYPGPDAKAIKFADKFEAWAEVIIRNIRHIAHFTPKSSN